MQHEPIDPGVAPDRGEAQQPPRAPHTTAAAWAAPDARRDAIVAAAVELLDAEGMAGFSMRKLGQRLGSGTTSVYWYVANKEELIDLARDQVLGEVPLPGPGPDWRAGAADYVRGVRDVLRRHAWLVSAVGGRPTSGPNALRLSDRLMGALASAGFAFRDSALAASTLTYFAIGVSMADVSWRSMQERSGRSERELTDAITEFYGHLPDEYPNTARWWRESVPIDIDRLTDEAFEFGLQRQLDGLATLLAATARKTEQSAPGDPEPR